MKRTGLICLSVVWLSLLGLAGFKARTAIQRHAEHETLAARQRQLEIELAALRREQTATAADLAQAEQQLAALAIAKAGIPALKAEHRDEIDRWLGRIRHLRQIFTDHPNQRIPEMQFLKDEDWLRVAKTHAMETDDDLRAAAADLRSAGVGKFAERLLAAMRRYGAANKNERPANTQVLAAYFEEAVDPMLLERYAVTDRPSLFGAGPISWGVSNKSPVDPDYDSCYQLMGGGSGMTIASGPLAWNQELSERYRAASAKYRRANPGQVPRGVDMLLPFFDPPLEKELAERLLRAERK